EALEHRRALAADGLGPGDVLELLGEEDVAERALTVTASGLVPPVFDHALAQFGEHRSSLSVCWAGRRWRMGWVGQKRPLDARRPPGCPGGLRSDPSAVDGATARTPRAVGHGGRGRRTR